MKKRVAVLVACLLIFVSLPALAEDGAQAAPKYVFLFIGDGMGGSLVTAARDYLGARDNPDAPAPVCAELSFTDFPYLGLMTTHNASSFCTDSASAATAMASGEKTISGAINYGADLTRTLKPVSEYAKEAGKKVGVITSVSIDNATPAAFYAKAESRNQLYEIALQGLTGDTLDYLGGGGFVDPDGIQTDEETGETTTRANLFDVAAEYGWTYAHTNEAIRALNAQSGRVLAISPVLQENAAMTYEIDRLRREDSGADILSLSEFVTSAINVLDNENGFFLMCEGGKIDWSSHANDAAASICETIAFSDAVSVALDFAALHPDDTLIVVTSDHETGGMSVGYALTHYDTYFELLQKQDISYVDFDIETDRMRETYASFEDALAAIEAHYGLTTEPDQALSLTDSEMRALEAAYARSMLPESQRVESEEAALLYDMYEPLSTAVDHILAHKAGLSYTTFAHTGAQIPVYAQGAGAEVFAGLCDNTDIFRNLMRVMGLGA